MTSDGDQRNPRSDAPLEGRAALDLYLTVLGRSVAAITEQSVLLLKALNERVTLMRELRTQQPPPCAGSGGTKPEKASEAVWPMVSARCRTASQRLRGHQSSAAAEPIDDPIVHRIERDGC